MSCEDTWEDARVGQYIAARGGVAYLRPLAGDAKMVEGFPRAEIEQFLPLGCRYRYREHIDGDRRTITFGPHEPWGAWEHPE